VTFDPIVSMIETPKERRKGDTKGERVKEGRNKGEREGNLNALNDDGVTRLDNPNTPMRTVMPEKVTIVLSPAHMPTMPLRTFNHRVHRSFSLCWW
jgi:hypothetical protein